MATDPHTPNSTEPQPEEPLSLDTLAKLAGFIMKYPPMRWPEIDGIIISTLTQVMILNKHDMGGIWGRYYEEHIARLLMTLTVFRQIHEDPKFWWRVRAQFVARVEADQDLIRNADMSVNLDPEVEPFEVHGPSWHLIHAVFETINMDLGMPDYAHFERMPESAYPPSKRRQGFDEYANLVATVYGIEGQQIKPNDPRLQLPDNRCRVCLATLKEPQVLTPVRKQAHQFLQDRNHFKKDCPNYGR